MLNILCSLQLQVEMIWVLEVLSSSIIYNSFAFFFSYNPEEFINRNPELAKIVEQIQTGFFTPDQPDLLQDVAMALKKWDRWDFLHFCRSIMWKTWMFLKEVCRIFCTKKLKISWKVKIIEVECVRHLRSFSSIFIFLSLKFTNKCAAFTRVFFKFYGVCRLWCIHQVSTRSGTNLSGLYFIYLVVICFFTKEIRSRMRTNGHAWP